MALTNIFREPRREITETAIGIFVIGGLIFADYALATYLLSPGPSKNGEFSYGERVALAMLLLPIVAVAAAVLIGFGLGAAHAAGEGICNRLQAAGIHLRPRRRY